MKAKKVIIYQPRPWSKVFHETFARFKVLVLHRRAGKTTAGLAHLIRDCMRCYRCEEEKKELLDKKKYRKNKDGAIVFYPMRFAFISPTYRQSKRNAWDLLKELTKDVEGVIYNESELRCDFANGSRITLLGADNPDSLRGLDLWGVVFDEYSQQPSNIYSEIISPALASHAPYSYSIWLGTPKGHNSFYDLYEFARNPVDKDGKLISDYKNWQAIKLTVDDTGLISKEELESQKRTMTNEEYLQEWYCSFDASIKGAYYASELEEARQKNRVGKVPYDPMLPVYTFWDLGMNDSTSIGFFQMNGQEYRLFDYYENHGKGLDFYLLTLKEKESEYRMKIDSHFFPHDIEVKELGTGISRKEMLEKNGIKVNVVPKLNIMDGINAGRMAFRNLWIDDVKCKMFLEAIAQYRQEWNDKMGKFEDKPCHDWTSHAADMYRYFAVSRKSLNKTERKAFIPQQLSYHRR